MGSLNASGIPVVAKQTATFRKQDIRIISTDNTTDTISVVTSNRPSLSRAIGSGSIVRDDNINPATVEYIEEVVWGVNFGSRSTSERLARDGAKDLSIADEEVVVIPTGLLPNTPQAWVYQGGDRVGRTNSITDTIVDRVSNTGVFG
jgi:hypothetical protein